MASLIKSKTKKGTIHYVQLSPGENETRPKISLGVCKREDAQTAKSAIQDLVSSCCGKPEIWGFIFCSLPLQLLSASYFNFGCPFS